MLLPVQDCGAGVNLDLLPSELAPGMWSDASNMRFRNQFAEKRKGISTAYTTPTVVPYWIGTFNTASKRFLMQLGTASAFADDGATRTEITGPVPTGVRDDRWTAFDFNGIFVCNNAVDDPMYWNGDVATDLSTLTGWPAGTKADALRGFRYYIFALAPTISGTKYPYRLIWGNAAEPGALPTTYTATATNDAGSQDIAGIGHLVDALPYGDTLIVYGQEGRYAVRHIGGTDVFSFQQLPGKDGLLTRGCVVQTPLGHVFLTNGDVRIHSGAESKSIAEGRVRDWLIENMDATNAARSFVCLNPQETEVWVVFPSTGQNDCNTVLAWNWVDDAWAKFSIASIAHATSGLTSSAINANLWSNASLTWATDNTLWSQNEVSSNESRLIIATTTPKIGIGNTGYLDFATSISWSLERRGLPLSETGDMMRPISRIRPRLDAGSGALVTVKVATTANQDDTPTFPASSTYTQGTTNYVSQFTTAGRYGAVRLEGADDQPVALRSYQLEVPDVKARF